LQNLFSFELFPVINSAESLILPFPRVVALLNPVYSRPGLLPSNVEFPGSKTMYFVGCSGPTLFPWNLWRVRAKDNSRGTLVIVQHFPFLSHGTSKSGIGTCVLLCWSHVGPMYSSRSTMT